jgi:hypothetical protein
MAITTTQVLWSSAATLTVSSATEVVSDVIDFSSYALGQPISFQLNANNSTTPVAGDTAVWRIRWTNGDVENDGAGDDDYDTAEHAEYLATLDTVVGNTPGEDPAIRTYGCSIAGKKAQLGCICVNAGTRSITISARWAV